MSAGSVCYVLLLCDACRLSSSGWLQKAQNSQPLSPSLKTPHQRAHAQSAVSFSAEDGMQLLRAHWVNSLQLEEEQQQPLSTLVAAMLSTCHRHQHCAHCTLESNLSSIWAQIMHLLDQTQKSDQQAVNDLLTAILNTICPPVPISGGSLGDVSDPIDHTESDDGFVKIPKKLFEQFCNHLTDGSLERSDAAAALRHAAAYPSNNSHPSDIESAGTHSKEGSSEMPLSESLMPVDEQHKESSSPTIKSLEYQLSQMREKLQSAEKAVSEALTDRDTANEAVDDQIHRPSQSVAQAQQYGPHSRGPPLPPGMLLASQVTDKMRARQWSEPQRWTLSMCSWCTVLEHFMQLNQYAEIKERQRYVSMYDCCEVAIKPWTRGSGCGQSIMMSPDEGKEAKLMLSHAWGEDMEECHRALKKFFLKYNLSDDTPIWFW